MEQLFGLKQYHALVRLILLLSIICILGAFQGCNGGGGGGGGKNISGLIETDNYSIGPDEVVGVTGDLEIIASGSVDIAGVLEAATENGHSIAINAVEDITIKGSVLAGNGSAQGGNGGGLTLISQTGDIFVDDASYLSAGDGGSGKSVSQILAKYQTRDGETIILDTIEGGKGGNGASITLNAPNGIITLPSTPGAIHIGDGGAGETISIQGEDLLTTQIEGLLANGGGDSGTLFLEASQFLGPQFTQHWLEEDYLADDGVTVISPAGTTFYEFNDINPISGGNGGHAGDLYYGINPDNITTWPMPEVVADFQQKLTTALLIQKKAAGSQKAAQLGVVEIEGSDGGRSIYGSAGNGTNIGYTGADGAEPGSDGVSVTAIGGGGGYSHFGNPGNGGYAIAKAGNGAHGSDPSGNGGDGGDAIANGGDGANNISNSFPCGSGGYARAEGGDGGRGGSACPEVGEEGGYGGYGGHGGKADSYGGNTFYASISWQCYTVENSGRGEAYGGDGGNGGSGPTRGGDGGNPGIASAGDITQNGSAGASGGGCLTFTVSPDSLILEVNQSSSLNAFYGVDEKKDNVSGLASWASSNISVVSVGTGGTIMANGEGSATITASYNGMTAQAAITVKKIVATLTITPSHLLLGPSDSGKMTAMYTPQNQASEEVSDKAVWSSSDPGVATVGPGGQVHAVSEGSAIIEASYKGEKNTAIVDVVEPTLSVTPTNLILDIRDVAVIKAVYYSGTKETDVTADAEWISDNAAVAKVSAAGVVTAENVGATVVRAKYKGKFGEVTVQVYPAETLEVIPAAMTLKMGEPGVINAQFTSLNIIADVSGKASWTSSNPGVAKVSQAFGIAAIDTVSPGTTTVTATYENLTATAVITVTQPPGTLAMSPTAMYLKVGDIAAFAVMYTSGNVTMDVSKETTWTSSNLAVATVSQGDVAAISPGTTTITATYQTLTATAVVTVTQPTVQPTGTLKLSPTFLSLKTSEWGFFKALYDTSSGVLEDVSQKAEWSSDNEEVASVGAGGFVTGNSQGIANITAVYNNQSVEAKVYVSDQ